MNYNKMNGDLLMKKIIKDINDLKEMYNGILDIVDADVEYSMEGFREHASYSKSEARLVEYYHTNNMSVEIINGDNYIFYGVTETKMAVRIGGSEVVEGMEITYYPEGNANHIYLMREMLILDALYNARNQELAVNEYVDKLHGINEKIDKFKNILESFGAKDPVEINLLMPIPTLNKEALNNLVTYIYDKEVPNRLLTEEELNTLNSLYPIKFEIKLNFYTSNVDKHYSFVSNLFRNFLLEIDINKYLEKQDKEQVNLRDFCLASINKEDKERQIKKKI